jgi:hypothetical protein
MSKTVRLLLPALAAIAVAAPLATTQAQTAPSDYQYCAQLSEFYVRYVGNSQFYAANRRPEVEGRVAIEKCQQGDTAWAIPVLERKLANAGVKLPLRG